ncbi:hypothetical protein WAI453_010570 [Rhynchosporium graminicola]
MVKGGTSGVGFESVNSLFSKGGTIYIANHSLDLITAAIEEVEAVPNTILGQVKGLQLNLADLTTISTCFSTFLSQETRLDLHHNAGFNRQPQGTVSKQCHQVHMATNFVGRFLLANLLLSILLKTVELSSKALILVIYTLSGIMDLAAPPLGLSLASPS